MSELPINQIVTGDCREVMAEWPEDCIDFVMFSPPYWGLRSYEEAESVWGGDEDCDHIWGEKINEKKVGNSPSQNTTMTGGMGIRETESEVSEGKFCQKCGAWCGQLGLEPDYRMYVRHLVEIGREIKRILKPSGSWYLNLGDTYAGSGMGRSSVDPKWEGARKGEVDPPQQSSSISAKCKMLMPYRVALALIDDGWICRNDIIWLKPNPMPSSVKDRLNTTTERIFHFVKEKQYYYDLDAIREPHKNSTIQRDECDAPTLAYGPSGEREVKSNSVINHGDLAHEMKPNPKGKNPGDVIEQTTQPFPEAHFAVYPPDLCEKPIKSSCPPKVCSECGKPYEREEHEKQYIDTRPGNDTGKGKSGKEIDPNKSLHSSEISKKRQKIVYHVPDNFKKTCSCSTNETISGIVLDPMCGAGSTLVKAKQLGRRYIGIEISDEYAEIARERLEKGDEKYKRRKRKERRLEKQAKDSKKLEAFC